MKKEKVAQACNNDMILPSVIRRLLIIIHGLGVQVNEFTCHVTSYIKIFQLINGQDYAFAPIIEQENRGDLYAVSGLYLEQAKSVLEHVDDNTEIIMIGISNGGRISTKLMQSFVRQQLGGRKILITLASPLKGTGIVKYASKISALYNLLVNKIGNELVQGLTPGSIEVNDIENATNELKANGVNVFRVGGSNDLIVNPPSTTYFEGENHIIIKGADHGTIFGHPQTLNFLTFINTQLQSKL